MLKPSVCPPTKYNAEVDNNTTNNNAHSPLIFSSCFPTLAKLKLFHICVSGYLFLLLLAIGSSEFISYYFENLPKIVQVSPSTTHPMTPIAVFRIMAQNPLCALAWNECKKERAIWQGEKYWPCAQQYSRGFLILRELGCHSLLHGLVTSTSIPIWTVQAGN